MDEPTDIKSFSIQVTVQRTTTEYGFVSVPLNSDMIDEEGKPDTDKLFLKAVKMGTHPDMEWHPEEIKLDINPMQKVQTTEKVLTDDIPAVDH